RSTWSTSS
ncbi:helicase family protein, partial [Vibrio parahaemolyticus V-223/04]